MAGANKASMEMVKKIYFWVLVPILIIVAFIVATMAIGDIKKKFEEKKKAVESEKQALDGIASDDKHPNDSTIDLIKKETGVLSKSVFEAWTLMYTDQKLRNRWPRQLSKEFLGLVEKLKFRASIDPTKPYLREDYSFFIGNHLPTLLKEVQRRRVQIHDYKYVKSEKRFFPVYVDTEKNIYYILITEGESDRVKEVQIYDIKRDLLTKVENSGERDAYISKERKPYYREMDPWIVTPKDYMTFGMAMNNGPGMGGEMGGMMGDPSMAGGAPGMGAPGMGGPGMEAPGGARGSMGGEGMGMSISSVSIPGDNTDPALEQLPSSAGANAGAAGAVGVGMDPGMGPGGVGAGTGKGISYPGLPPYEERKKIVGNVDWENPEIYALPTWSKGGYPKSIEIWYAQESLWVYEAMIRVIAETNKEAPDNINLAPVKAIEAMLIGQPAGVAWASVKNALGDLTGKTMSADSMLMGSGSEMMSPSSASAGSSTGGSEMGNMSAPTELTENEILNRILFGRYLDLENKPLDATTAPPFAEFNKMPVCMKLIIDQRRVPDLLVNCANCSMPIDIKHVRICPDNLVPFGNVSGMGGMDAMGGDPTMMGGAPGGAPGGSAPMGGARGSMGGEGGPGSQSASIEVGRSEISQINGYGNDAIRVEIYGIINIFNEPDLAKLATGNTAEGEKADSEAGSADNTSENKTEGAEDASAPATPAGAPAPTTPAGAPAPATPAGAPAPATPAGTPAPATPAGASSPATPAGASAPATPAGTPAPTTPAGTPAPANPT